MINKYQFLSSAGTQTTLASIFISGDFAANVSGDSTNNIIDVQLSYGNFSITSNQVPDFYPYNGNFFSRRLPDNNFGVFSNNYSTVTGYTITQDLLRVYSQAEKTSFVNNTISYLQKINANQLKIGINFEDVYNNDTFVNINLRRSFSSLETLTIKNNALGSWNTISSLTGIVFGTLTATQKINDNNGNPIQIPLRNVPIMVFNQTNEVVTTFQTSQDGRTPLNMVQNSQLFCFYYL